MRFNNLRTHAQKVQGGESEVHRQAYDTREIAASLSSLQELSMAPNLIPRTERVDKEITYKLHKRKELESRKRAKVVGTQSTDRHLKATTVSSREVPSTSQP